MTSRLLINEPPLQVLPSLAVKIGLNEALFLQQTHYWLMHEKNQNFFEDRYWVHNTISQWNKQFPFWAEKTLRRTIENLIALDLLSSSLSTSGFKRTKFYTINYDRLEQMGLSNREAIIYRDPDHDAFSGSATGQNDLIDLPKWANASGQNDQLGGEADRAVRGRGKGSRGCAKTTPSGQNDQIDLPKTEHFGQIDQMQVVKMTSSYIDSETTFRDKINPPLTPPGRDEDEDILTQMISFWNFKVQTNILGAPTAKVGLTDKRRLRLMGFYRGLMNSDLLEWRRYCELISQIRFLLGHGPNGFKISLEWATDPDNALKILEGKIYDKPGDNKAVKEKSTGELNQDIEDLFNAHNYPAEWLEVYRAFARLKGQAAFEAWLRPCVPSGVDGQAVLVAPTRFHRDHVSANYLADITAMARGCWKNETEISIEVKK